MKNFELLIFPTDRVRSVQKPLATPPVVAKPAGHPLDDEARELFNLACIAGDLEGAAEVLAMLERWMARRTYENAAQRRADKTHMLRMRGELERRHRMAGVRLATRKQAGKGA